MPDTNEIIIAIQQIIKTNIVGLVITFVLIATFFLLLKVIAEALAGYIQFRLDQYISIGSPIEIYGKKGRIKEVSIFTITIETRCGFVRVPTKLWRASRFLILKDRIALEDLRTKIEE